MINFEIERLGPVIGAEVHDLNLRQPLTETIRQALRRALWTHLVLVIRDQEIDEAQFVSLARCFGDPIIAGRTTSKGGSGWRELERRFPEIVVLDSDSPKGGGSSMWHTDATYQPDPPVAIALRAISPSDEGGDTCFSSMYAAYEDLSPAIRSLLDGLSALHDVRKSLEYSHRGGSGPVSAEEVLAKYPPTVHPVVRSHPLTGRKALFVNRHHTVRILDLSDRENEALLPLLFDHVGNPEFQLRMSWKKDYIAIWDNWSTQHMGVPDYKSRRVMQRVGIAHVRDDDTIPHPASHPQPLG